MTAYTATATPAPTAIKRLRKSLELSQPATRSMLFVIQGSAVLVAMSALGLIWLRP